jgi:predicted signal transduction protein with EAL and GGDEF domain
VSSLLVLGAANPSGPDGGPFFASLCSTRTSAGSPEGDPAAASAPRLPARYLKIDIEFVRNPRHNERDRHVIRAIVALATGFGQETIAEGVEDEETLVLLRELGVDFAQGFHIGQPTRHVAVAR